MADEHAQADRITRLEESLLFAERRLDELHEEVLGLAGALEHVAARLGTLERLALGQEPGGGEDPADEHPSGSATPP